ncbi:MAG: DUF4856 domain-containing protein, partial [Myxococcota bacterium]
MILPLVLAVACSSDPVESTENDNGGGGGSNGNNNINNDSGSGGVTAVYSFDSRFEPGLESVNLDSPRLRGLLIVELFNAFQELVDTADVGSGFSGPSEIWESLRFYLESAVDDEGQIALETSPAALQTLYSEISEVDLIGKLAGNDPATDHKDWATEFAGTDVGLPLSVAVTTPQGVVDQALDDFAAQLWTFQDSGARPQDPIAGGDLPLWVTPDGLDLRALVRFFLWGSVAYSQITDDLIDSATAGRGVVASNGREGSEAYSSLESNWDQAFGYFGAAVDYPEYSVEELAGLSDTRARFFDQNSDNAIDLVTEFNHEFSLLAGLLDATADPSAATNYSGELYSAFYNGREAIRAAGDEVDATELALIEAERDAVVETLEKVVAGAMVINISRCLEHVSSVGTPGYSFAEHSRDYSRLKALALSLQFNPRSTLSEVELEALQDEISFPPFSSVPSTGVVSSV